MIKYEDIVSLDKLEEMYKIIKINTKNKGKLFNFKIFYSMNMCNIYNVLKRKKYNHGQYNIFLIHEPKERIIMSERLSDKIVNHLISRYVLEPLILPKLINTNVATRKGLGTKAGIEYFKSYVNKLKINYDNIYILRIDIRKYFFNINHDILMKKLFLLVKDNDLRKIIANIIYSTSALYVEKTVTKHNKNLYDVDKMLPIGNMTSQLLAIFYLNDIDHFIKEKLRCKYYIRYMDDLVILSSNKEELKRIKVIVESELKKIKLEVNDKTMIYNLKNGFNFLGYKFVLKKKRLIMKINNRNKYRIKKKINELNKSGYKGYLIVADTKSLIHKNKWKFN